MFERRTILNEYNRLTNALHRCSLLQRRSPLKTTAVALKSVLDTLVSSNKNYLLLEHRTNPSGMDLHRPHCCCVW